jgi:hypothetical protein
MHFSEHGEQRGVPSAVVVIIAVSFRKDLDGHTSNLYHAHVLLTAQPPMLYLEEEVLVALVPKGQRVEVLLPEAVLVDPDQFTLETPDGFRHRCS